MSDTMAYRWLLKYRIGFPLFIVGELYKFQIFIDICETVQKGHGDHLKLSENLEFHAWVLSYDFLPYTCFSVTHGIMLGRQGGKCTFQRMRLIKC